MLFTNLLFPLSVFVFATVTGFFLLFLDSFDSQCNEGSRVSPRILKWASGSVPTFVHGAIIKPY